MTIHFAILKINKSGKSKKKFNNLKKSIVLKQIQCETSGT